MLDRSPKGQYITDSPRRKTPSNFSPGTTSPRKSSTHRLDVTRDSTLDIINLLDVRTYISRGCASIDKARLLLRARY
jgi:hypothetical protein